MCFSLLQRLVEKLKHVTLDTLNKTLTCPVAERSACRMLLNAELYFYGQAGSGCGRLKTGWNLDLVFLMQGSIVWIAVFRT